KSIMPKLSSSMLSNLILLLPLIGLPAIYAQTINSTNCPFRGDDRRYIMSMFVIDGGQNTEVVVSDTGLAYRQGDFGNRNGRCIEIVDRNRVEVEQKSKWNLLVLYRNVTTSGEIYFCMKFYWQSVNVIQYQLSGFYSTNQADAKAKCVLFEMNNRYSFAVVGFSRNYQSYNCKTIFEGVYWFTYQLKDSSRTPCDALNNEIKACQRAGSQERDNWITRITWGLCPGLAEMKDQGTQTYYCYGMWTDTNNNVYAAVGMDQGDIKFKYRCLVTRKDQNERSILYRWGMTVDADCSTLNSPDTSPMKLVLRPTLDSAEQVPQLRPGCNLPKNFTGVWFYPAEYQTDVYINATTIKMRRQLDQYQWEEVYFVCRQAQESRYLMAVVTEGRCDVDYICMHFIARHHNIIRFRMSKPVKHDPSTADAASYMSNRFREVCHWSSFTMDQVEWTYEYFVLNPPVPVNCPLQGRYKFNMIGQSAEKYYTKIPGGVTIRPRVQVRCDSLNESDLYACTGENKQLRLDVDRCMKLDHNGRPLSEYDVPDNILTCVGYWMEDAKSYLITYDPDDPVVGNFRCWIYRRTGLRTYRLSRSMASKCMPQQISSSAYPEESASLMLELTENERLFDNCPMKFNDGKDPYRYIFQFDVFAGASSVRVDSVCLVAMALATWCLRLIVF
ncbi:hypothetical protein BOX15_Mlig027224g1, partial [Macrostomum lignano]